jgi:lauroyl/myristoyl acyltransferase
VKTKLFVALFAVLERIPDRLGIALASFVAGLLGRRQSATRNTVTANVRAMLEATAHGAPIDEGLVKRLVHRNFKTYGRYWAEGATLAAVSRSSMSSRMVIAEGEDILRAALAKGNGVVLALPHVGSWEWGGAYLAHVGLAMTVVVERLEPEELFQFFVEKRTAMGLSVVPLGPDAGTALTKHLRNGGIVGLLCDRDILGGGQPTTLFGHPVTVPKGPATLALRTGATLLAAIGYSGPNGQHMALIQGPLDTNRVDGLRADVTRVTESLTRTIEGLIARTPDQWHVFTPVYDEATTARILS